MVNKNVICIIGSYDPISRSFFEEIKKKYKTSLFINVTGDKSSKKDIYNFKIFQLKKILNTLNLNNVSELIFLGKIARPNLLEFRNDGIVEKYIPILLNAYKKGDGAVLDTVIRIFKEQNFTTVSPFKYSSSFILNDNEINSNYNDEDMHDIKKSSKLLDVLSKFDNAQSVVSINGYIIAIEAAEGTDALLKRVWKIRKDLNQLENKSGFLTKKPKINQSKLIDLPVIGPKTIKLIKKANLKGLAIDPRNTMIYKKKDVLKLINKFNLKIYNII